MAKRQFNFLYTIPLGTCKEAKPVEQGVKTSHTPKLAELKKSSSEKLAWAIDKIIMVCKVMLIKTVSYIYH